MSPHVSRPDYNRFTRPPPDSSKSLVMSSVVFKCAVAAYELRVGRKLTADVKREAFVWFGRPNGPTASAAIAFTDFSREVAPATSDYVRLP